MYSQAAFADFLSSEASKHFSIDLSNASLCECLEAKIKFKENEPKLWKKSFYFIECI